MPDYRPKWLNTDPIQRALKTRPTVNRMARLPGSYISDLVSLGKAIMLCGNCELKFDHARNGYRRKALGPSHPRFGNQFPYVIAACHGCKDLTMCQLFLRR